MLGMDQVHVIRHKVLIEGRSQRAVAKELGLSRLTVRKYVEQAAPVRVEKAPRARPVWAAVQERLEELLKTAPAWTDKKQQLTATRLHALLIDEGKKVGVTLVKEAVAEWRRQRREVYVPLVYRPGELAEIDFFEVLIDEAGVRRKAWMFLCRLMYSGRDFAWLYHRQDQVSFLDGHVRAFAHFGGVPARIAYDNLRAAVRRILVGAERALSLRFAALAAHYLYEPCFCRPATGHDKGGVEARGKSVRWQHLVPIPTGPDLATINATLLARLDGHLHRRRAETAETIAERWEVEAPALRPLAPPFDAAATEILGASRRALVRVAGATYSVPEEWAGLDVTVKVGAETIEILGPGGRVIPHPRRRFGERSIDYRHYLRTLSRKPQAVRQVLPDLLRDLGAPFPVVWDVSKRSTAHGKPRASSRRSWGSSWNRAPAW
ncbi:MAG: IS21 family transposase [Acidobacteria bacterium]|nr:MAG: IS21 family transposase [Acidobacteriota bacterium]